MADQENRPRPKFTVRSNRRDIRRNIRHHNPGTKRRPPTPRVRVLSSITLVPPRDVRVPLGPSTSSQEGNNNKTISFEPPPPSPAPWATPTDLEEPPPESTWRKTDTFIPVTEIDYQDGFHIVPGEAYGPVPVYIDRDIPWQLTPIDVPVHRRVHMYRNDIKDPRTHDLRVEVVPIDHPQSPRPEPENPLFSSPRLPPSHATPTPDILGDLVRLLDETYGCPRPRSQRPPRDRQVASSDTPSTSQHPARESRFNESFQALLRVAKLFEGARPDTVAAYRQFKRPRRRDNR